MTNKTKYHGKTHFADVAYNTSLFSSDFNRFKSFINSKRLIKVPFIIYSDSKCVLVALTDNFNFGPNAKEVQDHSFCSYAYKLYVLMNDMTNHAKLILLKILLKNFQMI